MDALVRGADWAQTGTSAVESRDSVGAWENKKPAVSSGFSMAAGQGFEPQLPGPEPGVLPLDDPATGAPSLAGQVFDPSGPLISSR